jgi:hypothetical protein
MSSFGGVASTLGMSWPLAWRASASAIAAVPPNKASRRLMIYAI